jgi:hypothetical protein
MRVGHLLHERGKIAISLGPNDKMPMVGHQTVSAQPHPASSQRFLNDPLERQEVLVLGEKQSPAQASVEHQENHLPPENVASVVTFTAFCQDIPVLSIWWLSPFHPLDPLVQDGIFTSIGDREYIAFPHITALDDPIMEYLADERVRLRL